MSRKRQGRSVHGWLVIDKARGVTSTQAVTRIRRLLDPQKVGHGGTLDPLATGVLPIALGEATKIVPYVMDWCKTYRFTVRWGQATDTDDADGQVIEETTARPSEADIRSGLPRLTGTIEQIPPAYSAVKVAGRRAYDLARAHEPFELRSRPVRVDRFELVGINDADRATFEVTCGKGAYMRAIARDLGRSLGCLAHIESLRRLAVGPFTDDRAVSLQPLEASQDNDLASEHLLPIEAGLADVPALAVTASEANRLRCGQAMIMLNRANNERIREYRIGAVICAMSGGEPVALARLEAGDLRPVRVFNLGRGN